MRARHLLMFRVLVVAVLVIWPTAIFSAEVMFVLNDEFAPTEGDEAQIAIFEERGDTLDFWDGDRRY